ncbi:MOSC domain-containing protein [Mycolicibacterium sediminis]|uniref:Molybdenum cofactor biosysynthesis protein n=1 Tax=Mycolicibacterium sediminis TaxID=1286180 RepID=A0A7I7QK82_9MYCO|nr:MOSC domain-containing protein [Mycolicibacterium sediminis]BBY26714.1 molybdenum cofactor biosysynthesis protein [Mycolicibacterium sediminis]
MASVLTVNSAHVSPGVRAATTGIDKRPVDGPVEVRPPGSMRDGLGSGIVGDSIGNRKYHGGDDQAVYAYAREDLDVWQERLERELPNGTFGENVTTSGVDVTGALIGERWRIGSDGLVLEVTRPRTPCRTFEVRLGIRGWIKTFTHGGSPGAYLRIIEPGHVRAGDAVEIVHRPDHDVTIGTVYRAMMLEPDLMPSLLVADALPEALKRKARKRAAS